MEWWLPFYLLALLTSTAIAMGLAIYIFQHRHTRGGTVLTLLVWTFVFLCVCVLLRIFAPDQASAERWTQLHNIAFALIPPLVFTLTIRQTQLIESRPLLIGTIFFIPMITTLMVVSASPTFYADMTFMQVRQFYIYHQVQFGSWFWVHASYSCIVVLVSLLLLVWAIVKQTARLYQRQYIVLFTAIAIPFFTSFFNVLTTMDVPSLFISPLLINISAPIIYLAVFRYRYFDVMPIAHTSVFNSMTDAVFVVNRQDQVIDLNPTALGLIGKSHTECVGQSIFDLLHDNLPAVGQTGNSTTLTTEIQISSSGKPRFYSMRISHLKQREMMIGYLIVLHDITERKQIEQQELRNQLERERIDLLTNFVQNASHEFRTPLSVIQTSAYLMARMTESDKMKEKVDLVTQQVERINKLVEALLLMSELDARTDVTARIMDVHHILTTTVNRQRSEWETKNINVVYDFAKQELKCPVNEIYIYTAFEAILNNAIRYTPEGGAIILRTSMTSKGVCIAVIDNGIGIPTQELPYIFQRFYRSDKAHTTEGFGLGLSIAKRIVELHQGTIALNSTVDEGTSVTINLPA